MEVISFNNTYASGGRRLVAWFIDSLLISGVLALSFTWHEPYQYYYHGWHFKLMMPEFGLYNTLKFVAATLYFAFMEASKYQGTLGKIVMGIKVTDQNGQRVSFSKALLRNLSKLISSLLLGIGYLMIIFDDKKQGLHDKIADTFVVKD
jgi:uncharacterized RDD family membrane protein YckC